MKRSVFAIALCLGILASRALAANFAISGNISETVDGSNNYFLLKSPAGPTYKSNTDGRLNFLAQTLTTSYLFNAHYSYFKYFGAGAADTALTWGTPADARFVIEHVTELTRFNFVASWTRADVATTNLAQTGVATGSGSTNTYTVGGGITHDLGRRDTISWNANVSTTSFTAQNSTPYNDYTSAIVWNHVLSPTTNLINLVSFDWFDQDDPAGSQRLFWRVTTGAKSQLTNRLTVFGNGGLVFVNSYQLHPGQAAQPVFPGAALPFQPLVGAGMGWVADVGMTYRLFKTTGLSFNAAQAIIPTLGGALQQSYSVGMALNHQINQLSNISLTAQWSMTNASPQFQQLVQAVGGSSSEFFTASVSYGYRLTREWQTNLSYTYRQSESTTGFVNSSTVLVSLSKDFTVLGNPAPINRAEEARGRDRARQSIGQVFPGFQ